MHFYILTLFPDALASYVNMSILGRAIASGLVHLKFYNLRDYTSDPHHSVDDRPYGGGEGMLLRPDVVVRAVRSIKGENSINKVVLLSPRGRLFSQVTAVEFSRISSLLIICGRYEGVDQRAIDLVVDEEVSIGDYVISGGELAAGIVVDAISRMIPGVVGKEDGALKDSHTSGLLEHPHYTRPQEFEGLKVPEVLLSGDHRAIEKWRQKESLKLTLKNRPDLIKRVSSSED